LAILSALKEARGHVTAPQLLGSIDARMAATVDLSTVYRTLVTAERLGLVTRFLREGADDEFEWYEMDHHHLVCARCGRISELAPPVFSQLAETVMSSEGFLIGAKHLAISGVCKTCLRRG
jgi:Fur family ferric uptake transcriptional regulator